MYYCMLLLLAVALRSSLTMYRDEKHYFFTNVAVDKIKHTRVEVHGLLGQNAIEPPAHSPCSEQADAAGPGAGGVRVEEGVCLDGTGHQGEGYIEGVFTEYATRALDEHGFAYSQLQC